MSDAVTSEGEGTMEIRVAIPFSADTTITFYPPKGKASQNDVIAKEEIVITDDGIIWLARNGTLYQIDIYGIRSNGVADPRATVEGP